MAIEVMRTLMTTVNKKNIARLVLNVHETVANYLNNKRRKDITNLEDTAKTSIIINARTDVEPEHLTARCYDDIGNEVNF
jgi:ribonuclease E